jgi:serine/threonine protein kinase
LQLLTDMGFCKPLRKDEKTYTTCGTADYMAPEVPARRPA